MQSRTHHPFGRNRPMLTALIILAALVGLAEVVLHDFATATGR
jgi:hypothetical protein